MTKIFFQTSQILLYKIPKDGSAKAPSAPPVPPTLLTLQNTSAAAAPTSEKGRGWKRLLKNEAMARESPMNLPAGKGVCVGRMEPFFV